ncbi:olfactory receptor 13C9-like [Hyla sarda]|uniref:olfactory receptor 13C9-like n=1 Tax=Hyla sarda TaxID=327740 RepID=UPI0024C33573|nr:olfactory receptor 13C9-like [Hyla sarda]
MEHGNQTYIKDFILVGFSHNFIICILLFSMFFIIYILTIIENGFLIFTVIVSAKLHTPMYYFLCNLSFLDLCFSSSTVPKLLIDILSERRRILVIGCLTQMNTVLVLGGIECLLLAVMAYDRYIAICSPLYYTTIMSWRVCIYITVIIWLASFVLSVAPTMVKPFVFCKENQLNHFFCEVLAVLELACGDISFYKIAIVVIGLFTLLSPPIFILVSYICIIHSILKIHSAHGRSKAFSTCSSHLLVVFMFFGTSLTMYMGQAHFSAYLKYISLNYMVFTPVLNPMIYSLRNNEVKEGFWKIVSRHSVTLSKTA